ncbi:winged helix DNA-binding domain-containing protein [Paenibacillus pinisoli]|uniref:Winged helix DNA-binding domain-containing protein n=1 Tax=Paenibacillus pinisoli TaxID=1276110 RepID=A0A3A6PSR2_9BACL|nr:winged helix DNA-binding domain-containing protein [Paenibacillus pinisoli]RJX39701.1 winged helix DNA-binding domain-containing protein [Paenibacillus pinisoli]
MGDPRSTNRTLSLKRLNRALLERQLLLKRSTISPLEAIERLAGIQAQAPMPPYYALWSRLENFQPEALAQLLSNRQAVRIALMRSTIHLVSARDARFFRRTLAPMLERSIISFNGKKLNGVDLNQLAAATVKLASEKPVTFEELGKLLQREWPEHTPAVLSSSARNLVPLAQIPPRGLWGQGGAARHVPLEHWLGNGPHHSEADSASDVRREYSYHGADGTSNVHRNDPDSGVDDPGALETNQDAAIKSMLFRYLSAFGPASIKDMQAWSGMTRLKPYIQEWISELECFQDEAGNDLYDLPGAPLPPEDTPAPPRYLSEFDNMLISYNDRSRIMPAAYKPKIITINGLVRSTFLTDGFVSGIYSIEVDKETATLRLQPFEPISSADLELLREEGARLLEFVAPYKQHCFVVDEIQ